MRALHRQSDLRVAVLVAENRKGGSEKAAVPGNTRSSGWRYAVALVAEVFSVVELLSNTE